MPRAPKLCTKCSSPATKAGRCDIHQPAPYQGAKEIWEAKKPPNWEALRRRVIRKSRGRCAICHQPANQVDHINPVAQKGSWDLSNLRLLCEEHHRIKSQQEATDGRHPRSAPGTQARPRRGERLPRPTSSAVLDRP